MISQRRERLKRILVTEEVEENQVLKLKIHQIHNCQKIHQHLLREKKRGEEILQQRNRYHLQEIKETYRTVRLNVPNCHLLKTENDSRTNHEFSIFPF